MFIFMEVRMDKITKGSLALGVPATISCPPVGLAIIVGGFVLAYAVRKFSSVEGKFTKGGTTVEVAGKK
jgi:hypothetical protein